jgi:glyoxylase-like metal-dependent hydrolase (beta-lactamase superfamily II)
VPDQHALLVPNIGVIGGTESLLVVETGIGPGNAEVLEFAADHAQGRRLYLTTTHFHPEHAFGAQVFAGEATYVANRAQADDLAREAKVTWRCSGGLGEWVGRQLEGVKLGPPDVVYEGAYEVDLGGRVVHLWPAGRAHTNGDQVVRSPTRG